MLFSFNVLIHLIFYRSVASAHPALYSKILRVHAIGLSARSGSIQTPEQHFRRVPNPSSHLENWLAVKEARILTHFSYHQNQTRIDYCHPIT
jgi:hypothetical protein